MILKKRLFYPNIKLSIIQNIIHVNQTYQLNGTFYTHYCVSLKFYMKIHKAQMDFDQVKCSCFQLFTHIHIKCLRGLSWVWLANCLAVGDECSLSPESDLDQVTAEASGCRCVTSSSHPARAWILAAWWGIPSWFFSSSSHPHFGGGRWPRGLEAEAWLASQSCWVWRWTEMM